VTGNDVTWPQVTGSCPEVTSFDRKSPESGCRMPKTLVYRTLYFLQRCNSQDEAATWQEITSLDFMWPEVTRNRRHLTKAHLEVAVEGRKLIYCTLHYLQGGRPQEKAVMWQEMMWRVLRWLEVTRKWRHWTGSYLQVAVECKKLAYTVHFTFYKPVARRRRKSHDRKWRHVTSGDRKDPEVTSFHWESPGSGCRRPKTPVFCTFDFLQSCSSREEAITWQEMTSCDLRWLEVTRNWRNLTGSLLEVAVEGQKLVYTVHFTSYKAVACRIRQSRNKKWRHVISGDRNDPKVTSLDRKSRGSGCRRSKNRVHCTFHYQQTCSSIKKAVTCQEMTSRDLKWPKVTRKWRHLRGSHQEVAVEGQNLPYTVHFTSHKAVSRIRMQSHDRKYRHVTSGDRKWPVSDVIWPEVTRKWL